ncbi:MAG: DUF4440 domain-containing protein [Bryobacteraceae bacterium]
MRIFTLVIFALSAVCAFGADPKAEKEVLAAMEAWKQATLKKDRTALNNLLHEQLNYTHSNSRNETKADVLQSVTSGTPSNIESIEFLSTSVQVFGSTALVKGDVDIGVSANGSRSIANLNILHVWVKGNRGWQMVARQAVRRAQ